MKKIKLADVLWRAANEHLLAGMQGGEHEFSCLAAQVAMFRSAGPCASYFLWPFLEELGCNTYSGEYGFGQPRGRKRQGVRYMWLLLAMHVAEDEDIEIEVDA